MQVQQKFRGCFLAHVMRPDLYWFLKSEKMHLKITG